MAYNQGSSAADEYFNKRRDKMASQPDNNFFQGYNTNTGGAAGKANPTPKPKKERPDSRSRKNLSRNRQNLLRRQGR